MFFFKILLRPVYLFSKNIHKGPNGCPRDVDAVDTSVIQVRLNGRSTAYQKIIFYFIYLL